MAWYQKDQIIYGFAQLLLLAYILGSYELDGWQFLILLVVPGVYYLNARMDNTAVGTFLNNLILFSAMGYFLEHIHVSGLIAASLYLAVGAAMYVMKWPVNSGIYALQGSICFGVAGLFITGKSLWEHYALFGDGVLASIVFSVAFVILLLTYVRQGSLAALIFVCATILRFYFDTFFDFLPKSFFFIVGGLILLGFGFYFEKMRSPKGGATND